MNSDGLIQRIEQASEGMSARQFAQKANLSEGTLRSVKKGSSPTLETLLAICRAGNVSVGWLATGEGPMRPGEESPDQPTEFVGIPRYNATLSAGNGHWNPDHTDILDHIPFTPEFLRRRLGRSNPDDLIILAANGDSMEPQISDGDLVMIDQRKKDLIEGIFAITLNGMARVKRLRPMLNGDLEILSDNPLYDKEVLKKENVQEFQVIGKVVWCGHHFAR